MSIDEAWNSEFYKKLRLDMINGVKNPNCTKCHIQEQLKAVRSKFERRET